jgi:hypothetical protein
MLLPTAFQPSQKCAAAVRHERLLLAVAARSLVAVLYIVVLSKRRHKKFYYLKCVPLLLQQRREDVTLHTATKPKLRGCTIERQHPPPRCSVSTFAHRRIAKQLLTPAAPACAARS